MKVVEEKLAEAVAQARMLGITAAELKEMLAILFQEDR